MEQSMPTDNTGFSSLNSFWRATAML